jgi:alkylation response protein AidB-like acyl-CoA dehydrogenase
MLALAERFRATALDAVAQAHTVGIDLDDPAASGVALAVLADASTDLPLPGAGHTTLRFACLAAVAAVDVTLGRLLEAHADALAILHELAGLDPAKAAGQRWGVWAAEGPESTVLAQQNGTGFRLVGTKPWCSGAGLCTHALVTARLHDGSRGLFAAGLDPDTVTPKTATWQATGMTGSDTRSVEFHEAPADLVGSPGSYLSRPGFWHGAIGVAAVWWGAATGIAAPLYDRAAAETLGLHGLAHLGAVDTDLVMGAALLRDAAARIDDADRPLERLALTVRAGIESRADDVMVRVGRALGPTLLCHDRAHARRVADLTVYLRQSHAESDLERIARLTVGAADPRAGLASW